MPVVVEADPRDQVRPGRSTDRPWRPHDRTEEEVARAAAFPAFDATGNTGTEPAVDGGAAQL
ncbi:hypothetical protein Acsp01_03260 [Actinoplanes sp. NBRC 101535]|nr:hypothetical protein Acsp01_03260 [Actinoplanes sp. NBRC 101535]